MKKSSKSLFTVVLSVVMVLSMTMVAMFSVFADDAANVVTGGVATTESTTEGTTAETDESTTAAPTEAPTDSEATTAPGTPEILGVVGDLDKSGKIDSADARLVLRICARLDKADALKLFISDIDVSGKVVSYDARYILRYAARLDLEDAAAKANIGKSVVLVDGAYATLENATTDAA